MKTIITEISEGICYYPELDSWVRGFDSDPDDDNFDPLSFFEGDPDIVKHNDEKLYHFMVEIAGCRFVLTSDELTDGQKEILSAFYADDWEENFTEIQSSWEQFKNSPDVIAYRGGSGYTYTIWNYTPTKTLS